MRTPYKLTLLAAVLAGGCAISQPAQERLDQARVTYRGAAADPAVQRYAQPELQSAANALNDAERMAAEGKYSELVEHNAYLAERRAQTAQRTAQARHAEEQAAAAREERQRAEVAAREREAAAAREAQRQAEAARREAESRVAQLEAERAERAKQTLAASELAAEVKGLESADIRARETQRGWVLTLNNDRMFEQGITLAPTAEHTLDNVAQFLRKHPDRSVAIEGFTDSEGSPSANERLSERRAQAVKFALVQKGIEPSRIDARGYGSSFPVASNETEGGRSLNRRVEIVLSPS
jgi:outer membrane protein OmpA-like peptidoglycan-associated protein